MFFGRKPNFKRCRRRHTMLLPSWTLLPSRVGIKSNGSARAESLDRRSRVDNSKGDGGKIGRILQTEGRILALQQCCKGVRKRDSQHVQSRIISRRRQSLPEPAPQARCLHFQTTQFFSIYSPGGSLWTQTLIMSPSLHFLPHSHR